MEIIVSSKEYLLPRIEILHTFLSQQIFVVSDFQETQDILSSVEALVPFLEIYSKI
jgi:hypothetical protein